MRCPYCKKEFIPSIKKQQFCSQKCYQIFNKDKIKIYQKEYRETYTDKRQKKIFSDIVCDYCKKVFSPVFSLHKYCSNKCRQKGWYEINIIRTGKKLRIPKQEIIKKVCENCGFNKTLALHLHHLNSNDRKNNIMILCANCHTILHGKLGFNKKVNLTKNEAVNLINEP